MSKVIVNRVAEDLSALEDDAELDSVPDAEAGGHRNTNEAVAEEKRAAPPMRSDKRLRHGGDMDYGWSLGRFG